MLKGDTLAGLLKSLLPKNEEEVLVLKTVLACAAHFQQRSYVDFGPAGMKELMVTELAAHGGLKEFLELMHTLSADALRYFHGLVEAIDVYRSIHGRTVPIDNLGLDDKWIHELRQIRDICLDDGLHSIY
jgi:hypothetical protein